MSLTDWLQAYYKLDEWSWTTAFDSVGSNDWTASTSNILWKTWKINNSAEFNSSNRNITFPSWIRNALQNTSFSVSAWIKPNSTWENWTWRICAWRSNSPASPWFIFFSDWTSSIWWQVIINWNIWEARGANNQILLNEWNFVVMTYDKSSWVIKLYSWWNEIVYQTKTNRANWVVFDTLRIWDDIFDARAFDWKIDEVWIWNRVLTQAEITELYNNWDGLQYWQPWFWWDVIKRTNIFFKNN